jgi:hypothetical protein
VDDPAKEAKYTKSFTLCVGGDEVYEKSKADALEAELKHLVGGPMVAQMFRYDTGPTVHIRGKSVDPRTGRPLTPPALPKWSR